MCILLKDSIRPSQRTRRSSVRETKNIRRILYRKIKVAYCGNHTEHIKVQYRQNAKLLLLDLMVRRVTTKLQRVYYFDVQVTVHHDKLL